MIAEGLSIGELADAAGLSRRAVRFYVQQKLIDPPTGVGRGKHYGQQHLSQLKRVAELQARGHSLDDIRRIAAGENVAPPEQSRRRVRALVASELWTRLYIAPGIELHFDARRFSPAANELAQLRQQIGQTFNIAAHPNPDQSDDTEGGNDDHDPTGD